MKKILTMIGRFGKAVRDAWLRHRYPFLTPWNAWTGKRMYYGTLLDGVPDGWRKAFGKQMCDEIREALIEDGCLKNWRILQIKEKYGELRIYDNGHREGSRIPDILSKYESISGKTCIHCGAPSTHMTTGWYLPVCNRCCPGTHLSTTDN